MALTDERYNQTAALLPPEPSRAEYWLDKGFSDLGATIRESIVLNRVTRGELITELYNGGFIHKILWGICFLSFLVAGVAGTVIFAFIHSAVIMVVWCSFTSSLVSRARWMLGIAKRARWSLSASSASMFGRPLGMFAPSAARSIPTFVPTRSASIRTCASAAKSSRAPSLRLLRGLMGRPSIALTWSSAALIPIALIRSLRARPERCLFPLLAAVR